MAGESGALSRGKNIGCTHEAYTKIYVYFIRETLFRALYLRDSSINAISIVIKRRKLDGQFLRVLLCPFRWLAFS